MRWTPEREERLKNLWKKGHSGSEIASLLGDGATRNSVLGKAFRLNLEARSVSRRSTSKGNTEKDIPFEEKKNICLNRCSNRLAR